MKNELGENQMNNTNRKRNLCLALAAVGLFAAQSASAQYVSAGGTIRLDNGPGAGPGGEFNATVLSGGSGTFETFCLEKNEYFAFYGQTLKVQSITSGAMSGGMGGGVGGSDPLDNRTAYLYTKFRAGADGGAGLSGYDYGNATARVSDANALQNAIWYLEQEITSIGSGITAAEATQAQAWVNQANAAGWTNLGNVQALNLWRETTAGSGNFNLQAQDQLYITPVPEPETYMMLLAGLGLMGFVARRRQRGLAA